VLAVAYLVFNEGYVAAAGHDLVRDELCAEAVRLARLLVELMTDEPEVLGLLALLLLTAARRDARSAPDGSLVLLADQDRSRWDGALMAEGQTLFAAALRRRMLGPLSAAGRDRRRAQRGAHGRRHRLAADPRPLRPAARPRSDHDRRAQPGRCLAEVAGPAAALPVVDALRLDAYHLFHATRADLLRRLGRLDDAAAAYQRALELTTNGAERAFLTSRLQSLS
jgi:RNA polymerase sigma-70 factor (ECF subfamily)